MIENSYIRLSKAFRKELVKRRITPRESYEEIIKRIFKEHDGQKPKSP